MNVTELARKVRINTSDLLEVLPEFGFDIGKKAIKVDDKIAAKIIQSWPKIRKELEFRQRKEEEAKEAMKKEMRAASQQVIEIPSVITVRDFAQLIDIPVSEVIKKLMANGIMATLNERLDFDTASIVADEFGVQITLHEDTEVEEQKEERLKRHLGGENRVKRAPVIVIMGHVDHGKTRLLDTIRKSNVIEGEAGGITQHIGAYQVEHNGKKITFIDTPGHEAFTAMRSRGARIADIAILVVAADDSIKPQTLEAIKIIKNAGIPMIVAINKIDKPEAQVERVKQDLAAQNLAPEEWGGKTMVQEISATQNINIDKLLDLITLVDEMEQENIVANPNKNAVGSIIEAHVDKGEGPVATVLVQAGTLKVGDQLMINDVFFGKARALRDYTGEEVMEAGPSMPVKILGLKFSPKVGDLLEVPEGKVSRKSKKVTEHEVQREDSAVRRMTPQKDEDEEGSVEQLELIVKADTLGSLEVIVESLEKLATAKVKVKILTKGLGNITDTDIQRAADEEAMVIGFHVKPLPTAKDLANEREVEIKYYDIIYNLIDDVRAAMEGMIKPEMVRSELGELEVLAVFKKEKNKMVLGGAVKKGKIVKGAKVDVIRNGTRYETGEIINLQSGKQEVNEVAEGNECGLEYKGSSDVEVGDILKVYSETEKAVKL